MGRDGVEGVEAVAGDYGWMRELAFSYGYARNAYPRDDLLIVFDIDGTILGEGALVLELLESYDREHQTRHFAHLTSRDIRHPVTRIGEFLRGFGLRSEVIEDVSAWCIRLYVTDDTIVRMLGPRRGVLDVIRWFQLQERTFVALNTSRPEAFRKDTLRVLNELGRLYHGVFEDALVYMNRGDEASTSKVKGVRHFRDLGYRIVAVIDSDRENLEAVAKDGCSSEMLLIHTDIMTGEPSSRMPRRSSGPACDISELVRQGDLPDRVEFAWHGVDDVGTLRRFLVSPVRWAELHVRRGPGGRTVLRKSSYSEIPLSPIESAPDLDDFLYVIRDAGRGVKLDLMDPGLIPGVLSSVASLGFADDMMWLSVSPEEVRRGALLPVAREFPRSVRQCPADGLEGMVRISPGRVEGYLDEMARMGVNRFSVDWNTPCSRELVVYLQRRGYKVNIYRIPDLESFLQAALLEPDSITSYFNFPRWFYTGCREHTRRLPDSDGLGCL